MRSSTQSQGRWFWSDVFMILYTVGEKRSPAREGIDRVSPSAIGMSHCHLWRFVRQRMSSSSMVHGLSNNFELLAGSRAARLRAGFKDGHDLVDHRADAREPIPYLGVS